MAGTSGRAPCGSDGLTRLASHGRRVRPLSRVHGANAGVVAGPDATSPTIVGYFFVAVPGQLPGAGRLGDMTLEESVAEHAAISTVEEPGGTASAACRRCGARGRALQREADLMGRRGDHLHRLRHRWRRVLPAHHMVALLGWGWRRRGGRHLAGVRQDLHRGLVLIFSFWPSAAVSLTAWPKWWSCPRTTCVGLRCARKDSSARTSRRGGVPAMLRRLGAVQLDTISVLARSHELVAYARLGAIGRDKVEHAYWHATRPATFEYWAHAACILPLEAWPYYAVAGARSGPRTTLASGFPGRRRYRAGAPASRRAADGDRTGRRQGRRPMVGLV